MNTSVRREALLMVALVLAYLAIGALQMQRATLAERASFASDDNASWPVQQAAVRLGQAQRAVVLAAELPGKADYDDVALQIDLLLSANTNFADNPTTARLMEGTREFDRARAAVATFRQQVEPLIDGLTQNHQRQAAVQRIRLMMIDLEKPVEELTQAAWERTVQAKQNRGELLLQNRRINQGLTVVQFLITVAFAALMFRQARLRHRMQQQVIDQQRAAVQALRRSEEQLATRVDERTMELTSRSLELEAALLRQVGLLASLDTLDVPIFIKDSQARLQECNTAFLQFVGRPRDEVIGRTVADLLPPAAAATLQGHEQALLAGGGKRVSDLAMPRSDGRLGHLIVHQSAFVDEHGLVAGLSAALFDVSDMVRARELALANEAALLAVNEQLRLKELALAESVRVAEAASAGKSAFLALISHELRTPMSGVIGMLRLALRGQMAPTVREHTALALSNAHGLLAIVNDLLDLSKIEAGKMTLETVDFDLHALLDDVIDLLADRAADKGLALVQQRAADLPRYLQGDPTRLRQVVVNLLGNAIKFTEHGQVTLRVAADPAPPGAAVPLRITVADTGIGMDAEAQARLFQPFSQADASTTRKYGGTGLGLSICRQLVTLMGGGISLHSEPGLGSSFDVAVALATGQPPQAEATGPLGRHGHALQVLVAEDVYTNRLIIRTLLQDMGHQVQLAADGVQALQALASGHFHLVLMDGRMPEMDGLTATRHLRAGHWQGLHFSDPQVPVIALTANASDRDRQAFEAAGADGFLTKPIDEQALHRTVHTVIARHLAAGTMLPPGAAEAAAAVSALDDLLGLGLALDEAPAPAPSPSPATAPADAASTASTPRAGSPQALRDSLLQAMRQDAPQRLADLARALADDDLARLGLVAHGLRGSLAYLWPDGPARAAAGALEALADEALAHRQAGTDDGGTPRLQAALAQRLATLHQALAALDLVDPPGPPPRPALTAEPLQAAGAQ